VADVRMYCRANCPYCVRAERLLSNTGFQIDKIRIDGGGGHYDEMVRVVGRCTVPEVFVGDIHIGGYDDFATHDRVGQLDFLLSAKGSPGTSV
jgi:glutaredoxin 3